MKTEYIRWLVQIITIYNAILIGFTVKQIGINKYEFTTKNKNAKHIDLRHFIDTVIPNMV